MNFNSTFVYTFVSMLRMSRPFFYAVLLSLALASSALSSIPSAQSVEQEKLKTWCKDLSKELLSVNYDSCISKPWVLNRLNSHAGRPIPYLQLGNEKGRKVMLLGAIHGDEISAVSLVFRWMDFISSEKDKGKNQDATKKLSERYHFLIIPLLNPDGFFLQPRTRTNISGVDLNRNFHTYAWEKEAEEHWTKKAAKDPRRFPGKKAASESETQIIQQWIESFKPELIVSVHAPYGLVDHDGPVELSKRLRSPLPVKALGAFPGSLGKYAGIERKIPVVTVELDAAKKLPKVESIEELLSFILNSKF